MSRKNKFQIWVLFIILLLCFYFVEASARSNYFLTEKTDQVYILPNKKLAPMLSLGFNNIWADIITLQSQLFVHDHIRSTLYKDGKHLKEMIELIMVLDPHNVDAVRFVAIALMDDWGNVGAVDANEILLNSFRQNPDDHRLPLDIAFNYYLHGDNWSAAVKWFEITLKTPDAPSKTVWSIDAILNVKNDSYQGQAIALCAICEQAKEKEQKKNICGRCKFYQEVLQLESIRMKYEKDSKQKLKNIGELLQSGYIKAIPVDPYDGEWIIMEDGRINSSKNPKMPYVR